MVEVCTNLTNLVSPIDLMNCVVGSMFGWDFALFAIACMIGVALLAYYFRLPMVLGLGFAWALVYGFYLLSGGSSLLLLLMAVLTIGIAIRIITSLWSFGD